MQPTGAPPIAVVAADGRRLRASGLRAVLEFTPKLATTERLTAGVVLRLDNGSTAWRSAIDEAKAEHAFGQAGAALAAVASTLCASLAQHMQSGGAVSDWQAPFEGARVSEQTDFTARDPESAMAQALAMRSTLHGLLSQYELPAAPRNKGIVARVRRAVRTNLQNRHLAQRFERVLQLGDDTLPLRVDFLGAHYACYFVQVSTSERGLELTTERAYGKLYELQALRRFVTRRRKGLGLLDDERPERYELVVVGSHQHPVQRRALAQIEALADKTVVRAHALRDEYEAAEHLAQAERQAA